MARMSDNVVKAGSAHRKVLILLTAVALALVPVLGTAPQRASAATTVCALDCDTLDPSQAQSETFPTANVHENGDVIELHVDDVLGMAWASIDDGRLNDSIWIDRSWDGGSTWDGLLGKAAIPSGWTGTRTLMYNMYDPADHARAVVRACGDAGGVVCTSWVHLQVCTASAQCDGASSTGATGTEPVPGTTLDGRDISLHVTSTGMAWATISNGAAGDEVWMDRSWNEGSSWPDGSSEERVSVPSGATGTSTAEINIDDTLGRLYGGAVRACGRAVTGENGSCTAWTREDDKPAAAAADALMYDYDPYTAWWPSSWWNSAVALTSIIDYTKKTGDTAYKWIIDRTFQVDQAAFAAGVRATNQIYGDFISDSTDDDEWWALAWIDAYDLTGDQSYLNMAVTIADYVETMWDGTCSGGLWSDTSKSYKNAITNALYVRLTAELHDRISSDAGWLTQADKEWSWFLNSGMINSSGLVNDGLSSSTCGNNGGTVWTYNQGMTIGAAVEMYRATGSPADLTEAKYLADSAINSTSLVTNGILTESCDTLTATCDDDQKEFKGIFMDYLGDLNSVVGGTYSSFINTQINALWADDRTTLNQIGERWSGGTSTSNPNVFDWRTQSAALEALLAAE
ncbi:glycoside hydrolase family 76 protein [Actinospica acidithermotolerans]|nr:glycoside hydrolase family 76 protein [Actinospica acidithermotolerans]